MIILLCCLEGLGYLFFSWYFDCVSNGNFYYNGYGDLFCYFFSDYLWNLFNVGCVDVFYDRYYVGYFLFFCNNFVYLFNFCFGNFFYDRYVINIFNFIYDNFSFGDGDSLFIVVNFFYYVGFFDGFYFGVFLNDLYFGFEFFGL